MNNNELKQCLMSMINALDSGVSTIDEKTTTELVDIANRLTQVETKYSKYQACNYLGVSRSTFDNCVKDGLIPKGKDQQGFKEKFWLLSDLKKVSGKVRKIR